MAGRPKVLATRPIPPEGMQMLEEACQLTVGGSERIPAEEILRLIPGMDGLVCHYNDIIDQSVLDAAGPSLKVISTFSVGFDPIDVAACRKRHIPVGHTPNLLSNSVAEMAMTLLLATYRRIKEGMAANLNGSVRWESSLFLCGMELVGSTVGIVGLGRIGTSVARKVNGFDVGKLLYTDVTAVPWAADVGATYVSFDELLEQSDFVIATCSSTPENHGLFNKNAFQKMKNTAVFVNVTRGVLVNQDDLYEALTTGQIFGAGLDATTPEPLPPDSPLLKLDNLVVVPHIAANTNPTKKNMSIATAENILAGLQGKSLPYPIEDV